MKIIDLNKLQLENIEDKLDTFDENFITYKLDGSIQIGIEEDGKIVAGLDACITAFKILYVSMVFVDEEYRRKGFYEALNYEIVGSYENTDDGYAEYFFLKRI